MTDDNTGLNRLGIASFNCNRSLNTRRDIIAQTIIAQGINILALQDTGLTSIGDETSVRSFFYGHGYTFFSKAWLPSNASTEYSQEDLRSLHRYYVEKGHHHSEERSRLGILVHRSVAVFTETVYTGPAAPRLQALKVCLPGRNFSLVNVYAPIADELAANHRDLNTQLASLRADLGELVVILGDRNAVMNPSVDRFPAGDRMSDQDDALLNSLLECRVVDFFRAVSPDTPGFTFAHNGHCSRIDSIAGSPELADLLVDCHPLRAFLSDHDIVVAYLAISVAPVQRCPSSERVQFVAPRCSSGPPSGQWIAYQDALTARTQMLPPQRALTNAATIDAEASAIISCITTTATEVFGRRIRRRDRRALIDKTTARMTQHVNRLNAAIEEVRRLRSYNALSRARRYEAIRARVSRLAGVDCASPGAAVHHLRAKKKPLVEAILARVAEMRAESIQQFNELMAKSEDNQRGFKQFSPKINQSNQVDAVRRADGSLAVTPEEVLAETRQHYVNLLGTKTPVKAWGNAQPSPWSAFDQPLPPLAESDTFSLADVRRRLEEVRLSSAADAQGLNMAFFHCAPDALLTRVANLLTAIERVGHVPTLCQGTPMFLLPKQGSRFQLSNKRSIALMDSLVKIGDGIITKRATAAMLRSGRLHRAQWSGLPGRGCLEALSIFDQVCDYAKRHRQDRKVYVALVDFFKAFDMVPIELMCARIERLGLPLFARHLRTLYTSIQLVVMTAHGYTEAFVQRQGLFQGACSSPLAYVMFINCMHGMLAADGSYPMFPVRRRNQLVADPGDPVATVPSLSIVDDLCIFRTSFTGIKRAVELVALFGRHCNQFLSGKKTVVVTNDKQSAANSAINLVASHLSPPDRAAGPVFQLPVHDADYVFRYLGIYRSLSDRSSAHQMFIEEQLYTFLCHLSRKRVSGPFVSELVGSLLHPLLRYAAPFVSFKNTWVQRVHSTLSRVAKRAQGLSNRFRSDLFYYFPAFGLRSIRTVIDTAILAAIASLGSSFPDVISALMANDADIAAMGNGLPSGFARVQCFPWLKLSFFGDVQRILSDMQLRAVWSGGPLSVDEGDAMLFRWSARATGARSDNPRQGDHLVGAIAVPRSLYPVLAASKARHLCTPATTLFTPQAAYLRHRLNTVGPPSRGTVDSYNQWLSTFCTQERAGSQRLLQRLLVPPRRSVFDIYDPGTLLAPKDGTRYWVCSGSTRFLDPPRGAFVGGGCAACPEVEVVIPISTSGAQHVSHSVALGVLSAICATFPTDPAHISVPLKHIVDDIAGWNTFSEHQRAKYPFRSTMEMIVEAVSQRAGSVTVVVGTVESLRDLLPLTASAAREAQRAVTKAARGARWRPMLAPVQPRPPIRLIVCTFDLAQLLEGNLAPLYEQRCDQQAKARLADHPVLGLYFSPDAHPLTVSLFRNHKQRSTIWKARANVAGVGSKLVEWGILDQRDKHARCCCQWNDPLAPLETLNHLIFHCPLLARVAEPARSQPTVQQALGFISENKTPPCEPFLADRVLAATKCVDSFLDLWSERNRLRQHHLAHGL